MVQLIEGVFIRWHHLLSLHVNPRALRHGLLIISIMVRDAQVTREQELIPM